MAQAGDQQERGGERRPKPELVLIGAISVAVLIALSFAPALFNDGDTSWHLAAGRWMLEAGAVPEVDPFSHSFRGQPWVAHEWLSELGMAGIFRLAAWPGLSLLFGTAVALLLLMIGFEASRWLPRLPLIVFIAAVFVILAPYILARPHVLSWPIIGGWTMILLRARDEGRAPPLAAALLMLLWANLHGSFVFGLALVAPFALEAFLDAEDKKSAILRWAGFGLASALAAVATPHGVHGLLFPLQLSAMESLPLISEWRRTELFELGGFQMILLGLIAYAAYSRVRVPPIRLLVLAGLLILAFAHVRHQAVLAIVGGLILLRPIAASLHAKPKPLQRRAGFSPALGAALIVAVAAIWSIRPLLPVERRDSGSNPLTAIAHVPPELRSRPVLNSYGFGGPLILHGIPPFIDGRADMYGDAFMFAHRRIMRGDMEALDRAVERWRIGWTILSPGEKLAAALDKRPGWRRVYKDEWAVIHLRVGS